MIDPSKIRLVHTQDALHGMRVNFDGDLVLHRGESKYNRNTCHFSANCAVGNHAYGTFDGAIVVIADPRQMSIPSGIGTVDTWYHYDADSDLNVGRATILAPIGTDLPDGVHAVFYDGTVAGARNAAINQHIQSLDIEIESSGMWGWHRHDLSDETAWRQDATASLYGDQARGIQIHGGHSSSLDVAIDDGINACEAMLTVARSQFLYDVDGVEKPSTDVVAGMIKDTREYIASFKLEKPAAVVATAAGYLTSLGKKLDRCARENEKIIEKYAAPFYLQADAISPAKGPFSAVRVEELITQGVYSKNAVVADIRRPEQVSQLGVLFDDAKWPAAGGPGMPPPLSMTAADYGAPSL